MSIQEKQFKFEATIYSIIYDEPIDKPFSFIDNIARWQLDCTYENDFGYRINYDDESVTNPYTPFFAASVLYNATEKYFDIYQIHPHKPKEFDTFIYKTSHRHEFKRGKLLATKESFWELLREEWNEFWDYDNDIYFKFYLKKEYERFYALLNKPPLFKDFNNIYTEQLLKWERNNKQFDSNTPTTFII